MHDYSAIADELIAMAQADQAVRRGEAFDSGVDRRNTERLREVVSQIGWPTISKVGKEASQDAWLLAQHADHDPAFQRQCLELMVEAREDVAARNIAYLLVSSSQRIEGSLHIEPDGATVARMHEIIAEVGWPTLSRVGARAARDFGELAKCVRDVETKRRWLALLSAEPPGEVDPRHIAQFEDGLRRLEGRPQLYGSVFERDEHGEDVPAPIEDAEHVDERRRAIGLAPLADELDMFRTAARRARR